jgi:hypothetical protein
MQSAGVSSAGLTCLPSLQKIAIVLLVKTRFYFNLNYWLLFIVFYCCHATAPRYASFLLNTAQAIRAFLLAIATVAIFRLRRLAS